MKGVFTGKKILITGGAGFIGSGLAKEIVKYEPQSIRIFDNNEYALYNFKLQNKNEKFRCMLGDVRDIDRLRFALKNVDYVFHASALKHVSFCEFDPIDAVKTNVLGTQNLITESINNDIDKFILISTDKAVNPSGVMGATKLLAEKLVYRADKYAGIGRTKFSIVRFGNVLGSSGSIVPILQHRISNGLDLQLNHPDMTRFVMSLDDTVNLIMQATFLSSGNDTFILKMKSLKIIDLMETVKEIYNYSGDIEITRPNTGEKIHEELLNSNESEYAYENDDIIVLSKYQPPYFKKTSYDSYSSKDYLMDKKEIYKLLDGLK